MAADTDKMLYLQMQHASGGRAQQQTAKGAAVVAFVEGQKKDKGKRPPWNEVLRRWNKAHPQQRYEDESVFKKTYERAFRQIFAPLTEHLP